MSDTYCVQVRGHLGDRWADWLGGFEVHRQRDGTTVLVGPVADQAALFGLIVRIRDLGLPLVSIQLVDNAGQLAASTPSGEQGPPAPGSIGGRS